MARSKVAGRTYEEDIPRDLFGKFLVDQRREHGRTQRWWAKRWRVHPSMVGLWATGERRIGPDNVDVWRDLLELGGITIEAYDRSYEKARRKREKRRQEVSAASEPTG